MRYVRPHDALRTLLNRAGMMAILILILLSAAPPAFGLWLPWATEQDKVAKVLNDVWQALVVNNKDVLNQGLAGGGAAELFVKSEQEVIKSQGITKYDCRIRKIQIDPTTGTFAFVEYDKIATVRNRGQIASGAMAVLQKIDGRWKLVTGTSTKNKATEMREKASKDLAERGGGAAPALRAVPPARVMPDED